MTDFNKLFKHFKQPSLETQVVEIIKENSQQLVENSPSIQSSGSLVIESLQIDQLQSLQEDSREVQSKNIKKQRKVTKKIKRRLNK